MKGTIQNDIMPINSYELMVIGLPPITVTEVGGLEDELNVTELPDKTVASTGTRNASESDWTMPEHHAVEQAAMEAWFKECQEPVSPSYKKAAVLIRRSVGGKLRTWNLIGVFPRKRVTPDLEMDNEGEMGTIVWTMSIDDIEPI